MVFVLLIIVIILIVLGWSHIIVMIDDLSVTVREFRKEMDKYRKKYDKKDKM